MGRFDLKLFTVVMKQGTEMLTHAVLKTHSELATSYFLETVTEVDSVNLC